jgi:ABC-type protease/lipase transport system fused ATPase/permease subunit
MKRTVILISHRQTTLNMVDKIVILQAGGMRLFGPRQEVLAKLGQPVSAASLKREVA